MHFCNVFYKLETPTQYIMWRFAGNNNKESIDFKSVELSFDVESARTAEECFRGARDWGRGGWRACERLPDPGRGQCSRDVAASVCVAPGISLGRGASNDGVVHRMMPHGLRKADVDVGGLSN